MFEDGAGLLCYRAYVLRIWRYSGFLWGGGGGVPTNTEIFLHGLKGYAEKADLRVLLVSKMITFITLYFTAF